VSGIGFSRAVVAAESSIPRPMGATAGEMSASWEWRRIGAQNNVAPQGGTTEVDALTRSSISLPQSS